MQVESVAVVVGDLDILDIGTGLGWGKKEGLWPVHVISMLSSDETLCKCSMKYLILLFLYVSKNVTIELSSVSVLGVR